MPKLMLTDRELEYIRYQIVSDVTYRRQDTDEDMYEALCNKLKRACGDSTAAPASNAVWDALKSCASG